MTSRLILLPFAASFMALASAQAGVVYADDFSTGAGWAIAADADTNSTFGYDYSGDGIPTAPNGSDTVGLKLEANLANGFAAEIAAVHALGFSGTAYRVTFDMWTNFSLADSSSTEFSGGGVGHDGSATGRRGATLLVTGNGGSSRDFRLYKDDWEQFVTTNQTINQYGPTLASNNGSDSALAAVFTSSAPPVAQGQLGSSDAGDTGFQWLTMTIDVDPFAMVLGNTADTGTARFTLMSHASGLSIEIGTIDNSAGFPVVEMEGNVSLIHSDVFSSVASDPRFQFSLYDNLSIETVPEPSTPVITLLGVFLLTLRRRC